MFIKGSCWSREDRSRSKVMLPVIPGVQETIAGLRRKVPHANYVSFSY